MLAHESLHTETQPDDPLPAGILALLTQGYQEQWNLQLILTLQQMAWSELGCCLLVLHLIAWRAILYTSAPYCNATKLTKRDKVLKPTRKETHPHAMHYEEKILCLVINPSSVEAVILTAGRKQKAKQTHQLAKKVKKNPIRNYLSVDFLSFFKEKGCPFSFFEGKQEAPCFCHVPLIQYILIW